MDYCPITNAPCSNCKSYQITDVQKGEIIQIEICEKCAMYKYKSFNIDHSIKIEEKNLKTCKGCNSSYSDLLEKSRIGCEHCYDAFCENILDLLRRCQVSNKHIGKKPKIYKNTCKEQIDLFHQKMKIAVDSENYEEAAILKENIKKLLEQKIKSSEKIND